MSLFYNPQKSGSGISKEQAEMKPFFKFWELFGRKFWYLAQLNLIYVLLCLPVITIGPATAAITHVMRKFILEQPIFVFGEFFGAFKKNFKLRTVIMGIISLIFFFAFSYSMINHVVEIMANSNTQNYLLMAMNTASGVLLVIMNVYIYPQMVCLDLKMNAILKNSAILCIAGLKRNIVTVLVYITIIFVMMFTLPFSLIALPLAPFAQLAFLGMFNAYPVIQRYIINPFYDSQGMKNPELSDYNGGGDKDGEAVEKTTIFTDLGGKETPINKKNVKTTGKLIK